MAPPPVLQAVRGMNDVLPDEARLWERFEDAARSVFAQYGYRNLRVPMVEPARSQATAARRNQPCETGGT